jgi:hypothetical protein
LKPQYINEITNYQFRRKWWCFDPGQSEKDILASQLQNDRETITFSGLVAYDHCHTPNEEPPSYTSRVSLVSSTSSTSSGHIYEEVDFIPSSPSTPVEPHPDLYDTLNFQRPVRKLEGHYQSTKTLKTLCSQDDYLYPITPDRM